MGSAEDIYVLHLFQSVESLFYGQAIHNAIAVNHTMIQIQNTAYNLFILHYFKNMNPKERESP